MDRSEKRHAASGKVATVALEQLRFIFKVVMSFPSQSPLGSRLWGRSSSGMLKLPQVSTEDVCSSPNTAVSELGHTCAAHTDSSSRAFPN